MWSPYIPRRRAALVLLGLMHLGMGLRLIGLPAGPGDPDLAIWHELLPLWLRVVLWAGLGAVAIVSAVTGGERIGWTLVILMPVERSLSYAWSGLMWIVPGWPPGALASFGGAAFWTVIAGIIWLMAGWPEPQQPPRDGSQS